MHTKAWASSFMLSGCNENEIGIRIGHIKSLKSFPSKSRSSVSFKPYILSQTAMACSGHGDSGGSQEVVRQGLARAGVAKGRKHVVVCGAGVIGACTAFFLAQKGAKVTVVEKTAVACASSGKAGGFLASDWSDGGPLGSLSRASFNLHAVLAEELDGESYGYRRLDALSVAIEEDSSPKGGNSGFRVPTWVDGVAKSAKSIGSTKTTAQVHPELFTKRMLSIAQEEYGAELVTGEAQEVKTGPKGDGSVVKGVVVNGELITADCVVISMGPWSQTNSLVSSLTRISPLKAHSIVLKPKDGDAITPHALFLSYRTREGKAMDPEIYPRPMGEVYICGMSEEVPLPDDPNSIEPRGEAISMLKRVASTVSSQFGSAELVKEQACFLPCSEDSLPLIGKIPNVEGAYVATGHSCWGILNAPATGISLAELIIDGVAKTVNLSAFDPARFARTFAGGRKLFG